MYLLARISDLLTYSKIKSRQFSAGAIEGPTESCWFLPPDVVAATSSLSPININERRIVGCKQVNKRKNISTKKIGLSHTTIQEHMDPGKTKEKLSITVHMNMKIFKKS